MTLPLPAGTGRALSSPASSAVGGGSISRATVRAAGALMREAMTICPAAPGSTLSRMLA